ncbi:MAG: tRNA pseudouridine(55) synthase TruB [Bacteroidota bacterium]|jgi:tRNA pseudouridine55 synthase|nr:tRNA pseudouridine(55) synthase TruB [Ignavibacteria bacterium]MCU7499329.1 tRNA pseudouridine(55) synthase TruB [Ignavibacteria bacterium]MCU7512558.1 tRNA pseudouridine(55) synthase TruB [Ignavibacteria bacterium]MCU7519665.1 tRNA pseudouridine(55) synthase TruB [Ignavibacteria bacterium]MCU7524534.1 tRNA pseudouridine(55) synthase TruB [Ignavibacteria bacterium]
MTKTAVITRQTINLKCADFDKGEVILIDKPLYKSSFNMIYKIRKATGVKKAGHAGTLDPRATGLLIICTGKKTKEISLFQDCCKTYTGVITLGKTTLSMDSETDFVEEKGTEGISEEDILLARDSFLGEIFQTPPMYSAVKFKGKSLYKYARKGVELKREPRQVTISGFNITKIDMPEVHFEITCSKGTYIRVIAHDFGQKLGCGGYLSALRRTKIGEFDVQDAFTIDEFVSLWHNREALEEGAEGKDLQA